MTEALNATVRLQGEQLIATGLNTVFIGAALAAFIALLIALRLPVSPPEPSRDN
jgi:hypothetical protein